jgi:hypothetical protein
MVDRHVTALESGGLMTNAVLARLAKLPHVTTLALGGSRQLTDDGLRYLTEMPQLQHLSLSGVKLTDRGLEVLRQLPNLRSFELNWHRGITDAGIAHLASCDQLERVDLMGSATGDGAIRALQGKTRLRDFKSGCLVTDEGLRLLHNFPVMKNGDDGQLLIDGPFTDAGLASLIGLDGITGLDLFWHCKAITSAGFAHLARLPNLASLGADGALSDDISLHHIGTMPRLRKLRAQEAAATDAGFEALSRSRTLESLWGRECEHFGNRGFLALSRMSSQGTRNRLRPRGRPRPVGVPGVSRVGVTHAHRRHRSGIPTHRPLREHRALDVHVLPHDDRCRNRACGESATALLLCRAHADHRSQSGDSWARADARTG